MGLWDKLRGELIDIIEWLDESRDTMVWRFERYGNEIKSGAMLTVRESQVAAFVNEGELADVFFPGQYKLNTQNLPILGTLKGWKHGFESAFKSEVYFVNTRVFTDNKWGTKNPIMLRDPEFGPVRLRAFGSYAIKIKDPGKFLKEVVGTDGHFTVDGIVTQLRDLVISRFTDILGESKLPVLDLASNYDEMANYVTDRINQHQDFETFGLEVVKFLIENISLPPEVEKALDKRTSMSVIGNLNQYSQYQAAEAIRDVAQNPGGGTGDLAGAGMSAAMGFAMANQMANSMGNMGGAMAGQPQPAQPTAAVPPPLPTQVQFFAAIGGQQAGPFDMGNLQQHASQGQLTRDTLVWKQGMAGWTPAGQVQELNALFGSVPPPLPPQAQCSHQKSHLSTMSERQFPCHNCGAKVNFEPGTTALKCPYCGTDNKIPQSEDDIEELDFDAYLKSLNQQQHQVEQHTIKCETCAAETTLEENVTSGHCVFCGSPIVIEQASTHTQIKPSSLLPFKVKKKEAQEAFRRWISSLWFAPNDLKKYADSDQMNGVYLPYWTYDSQAESFYRGQRGDDYWETQSYTDSQGNRQLVKSVVRAGRQHRGWFGIPLMMCWWSLADLCHKNIPKPWSLGI